MVKTAYGAAAIGAPRCHLPMAECQGCGVLKNRAGGEGPCGEEGICDAAIGAPRCHLPMAECQAHGGLKNRASGEGPCGEEDIW